jgi:DNA mismatch repair ATPase MutS
MDSSVLEYLNYHTEYNKKYSPGRTLIIMQIGSFYEMYSTPEKGPDLHKISEITNILCTRSDKSNPKVSIKNPNLVGFPVSTSPKFIGILVDNCYTVVVIDQIENSENSENSENNDE